MQEFFRFGPYYAKISGTLILYMNLLVSLFPLRMDMFFQTL